MSPKSLLRHPLAVSSLEQLANGTFNNELDDPDALSTKDVKHIMMCAGAGVLQLLEMRREQNKNDTAIIRVGSYPFPQKEVEAILSRYSQARDFVWCPKKPMNKAVGIVVCITLKMSFQMVPMSLMRGTKHRHHLPVSHSSLHAKTTAMSLKAGLD